MKVANCVFEDDLSYTYPFIIPQNLQGKIAEKQYVTVEAKDYQFLPYCICRVVNVVETSDMEQIIKPTKYVTSICDNSEVNKIRKREKDIPGFVDKCQELANKYNGNFEIATNADTVGGERITYTLTIDG